MTDYEIPIQITVDLIDLKITHDFEDDVFETEQYDSLEDMVENGLSSLDFSDLVYVPQDILDKHTSEWDKSKNDGVQIEHKSENETVPEYNEGDHIEVD